MLWLLLSAAAVSAGSGSPAVRYEPSPPKVVQAMIDLADVRVGDVVYDLGCGDGRIVIAAARRGARGVCVDIDPVRIAEARENAKDAGVAERIEFRNQDLFEVDLSDATVVMLFLSPDFNLALRPRLQALKPGTRIVSHWHGMGGWPPAKSIRVVAGGRRHPVHFWTVAP